MAALVGWKPHTKDPRIASARTRCFNPLRELKRQNYAVELFDPIHCDRYEIVIYSKSYSRKSFMEAERLKQNGIAIIFDICDNHFYNPMSLPYWQEAADRLRRMVALADRVVTSTNGLAEVIRNECEISATIAVIGDGVEETIEGGKNLPWEPWLASAKERWLHRNIAKLRDDGRTPLVWFGNHGSPYADAGGMSDLVKLRTDLELIDKEFSIFLTIISNNKKKYEYVVRDWQLPTLYAEWNLISFLSLLKAHDIALIPVTENPFTRVKSNNRLALALQAGLAVVADAIPSYEPFSEACFLNDWEQGLRTYLKEPKVRARDIERGRAIIKRNWTIQAIARQWALLFDSVLKARS